MMRNAAPEGDSMVAPGEHRRATLRDKVMRKANGGRRHSTGFSLPQPLAGKGLSRSGLEVVLKFSSPVLIGKRVIAHQSPRFVLRRVDRTASIVGSNALLQIRGEADISLFGKRLALNEIDV